MKAFFILSVSLFALCVRTGFAEIVYKGTDEQGNPSFSDVPTPGSVEITVEPAQSYTPPPRTLDQSKTQQQAEQKIDYQIQITQPTQDFSYTTDIQTITVTVNTEPQLQDGDLVRLILNGEQIGEPSNSTSFVIGRLDRGTYQLVAQIVAANKETVKAESAPITFHQRRTTILAPTPKAN